MKIKILPLVSSLHDKEVVNQSTIEFLYELKSLNSFDYEIVNNVEELYINSDLSLLLIQTGGSENYFLRDLNKLKSPFYLLTYGFSNSLAAAIEILSYINQNNLSGEILHGSTSYISNRLISLIKEKNND